MGNVFRVWLNTHTHTHSSFGRIQLIKMVLPFSACAARLGRRLGSV